MGRIVVVEDDRDIRASFVEVLEDAGYDTIGFENGRVALEYLRQGRVPDLILLDLMMPVMNGYQFHAAQHHDPRLVTVPVVVITAHGHNDNRPVIDVAETLRKPIELGTLLQVAARYCSRSVPSDN